MSAQNYGRTVALTHEALSAMAERQAKQKALKDELDRQVQERRINETLKGGVDTTGMSKAQKKLLELQCLRQQQATQATSSQNWDDNNNNTNNNTSALKNHPQRPVDGSVPVHQSQSLPANFTFSAQDQAPQHVPMFPSVNPRYGAQLPSNSGGVYDTRSLPESYRAGLAEFGMPNSNQPPTSSGSGWMKSPMEASQQNRIFSPTSNAFAQNSNANPSFVPPLASSNITSYDTYQSNSRANAVPSPHPPPVAASGASAPRQVFTIEDVMGFVSNATDDPFSNQTSNLGIPPKQSPAGYGGVVTPKVPGGRPSRPNENKTVATPPVASASSGAAHGKAPSSSQAKDRHMLNKVERLQKELEAREAQMQKMIEKNKSWELQAAQLKNELKEERRRGKTMVPTRAETAPQPANPAPKKLDPITRPSNAPTGKTRAKAGNDGISSNAPNVMSPKVANGSFQSNIGFTSDQRPITAPEIMDPATQLMRSGHLPPINRNVHQTQTRQPLPLDNQLAKPKVTSSNTTGAEKNKHIDLRQTLSPRASKGIMPSSNSVDSVRYMGDPTYVREEEERVMEMMGSKAGFAFHSQRERDEAAAKARAEENDEFENDDSTNFTFDHLQWFVTIQLITAQQGRKLWSFFTGCEADGVPLEHVIPEGYEEESQGMEEEEKEEEDEEEYELEDTSNCSFLKQSQTKGPY